MATSAPAASPDATATVPENHNPTATAEAGTGTAARRSQSLARKHSSPVPEAAPVLGAVGFVGEPSEKAEKAANAFKRHQVEPPVHHEKGLGEKVVHVEEEGVDAGTERTVVANEREKSEENTDGDDDDVVYPEKLQLGLLTLGLCLATFTVALGRWNFVYLWNYPYHKTGYGFGPISIGAGTVIGAMLSILYVISYRDMKTSCRTSIVWQ